MVNIIAYNLQGPWWSLVYVSWIDSYLCISCEFESRWCEVQSIQQYVINFRRDLDRSVVSTMYNSFLHQ